MERPLKERLVGAALLVGLIVVLVPEMLSGPKDTHIAAGGGEDGAIRTYTIDLTAPGRISERTEPEPPAKPAPEPQPLPAAPDLDPDPKRPEPVGPAQTASPPASAPTAKPAPAQQPLSRRTPLPAPQPAKGWSAQVGSFASRENAERLTAELRAKGYKAFISTSGTGSAARHRVRVGLESTREAAQKIADKLSRDGQSVAVVSQ